MTESRWQSETSQYFNRLLELFKGFTEPTELVKRLPNIPVEYEPSAEGSVALRLALVIGTGSASITYHALVSSIMLWGAGEFAMTSLPARLVFEEWGAAHYARLALQELASGTSPDLLQLKADSLLLGARAEVMLPWGDIATEKSVHVMDLVRSLKDVAPDAEATYDFLCESCHPSFVQLTYWSLAGPDLDNWGSEKYRVHMHTLMDRTIDALEVSVRGICAECTAAEKLALPFIERDMKVSAA